MGGDEARTGGLTLDIAGNAGATPGADGACAGYLLRSGGTALLLDCGPGTTPKLRALLDTRTIDAIVISHMHSDHWTDLLVLNVALRLEGFTGERLAPPTRRIPIWLPPGGAETVRAVFRALTTNVSGSNASLYADVLELHEYDPGERVQIGAAQIDFVGPTKHSTLCYGMRVEMGGVTLGYTGDTAYCPEAIAVGQDADIFLAECSLMERGPLSETHLSAPELSLAARDARCKRLLATHFMRHDDAWRAGLESRLRSAYSGPIDLVRPGDSFAFV